MAATIGLGRARHLGGGRYGDILATRERGMGIEYRVRLDGAPCAGWYFAWELEVAASPPLAERPPQRAIARRGEDWWTAEEAENGWVPNDATWGEQPDDDLPY
jgi:hypothetical protein